MREILLTGSWFIRAPREKVYSVISDFEAMPVNFPKVARAMRITERDGSRLTIHARAASFGSVFPEVNVNETLGTSGHEEFLLRDVPGGTRIDYSYRVTIRPVWLRVLAGPLIRWFGLPFWKRAFIDVLRARLEGDS